MVESGDYEESKGTGEQRKEEMMENANTTIRQLSYIRSLRRYFERLPDGSVDQASGGSIRRLTKDIRGDFGSHVSRHNGKPLTRDYVFTHGMRVFPEKMEMSLEDAESLLQKHGATEYPFGVAPWSKSPIEVLKSIELELMEKDR